MNIFQTAGNFLAKSVGLPRFDSNIKKIKDNQRVLVNEDFGLNSSIKGNNILVNQPKGYGNLMFYFKINPEILAIVNAYVTDLVSDGITFKGKEQNVKNSEIFAEKVDYTEFLVQFLLDGYIQGNGMGVINFITDNDIHKFIGAKSKYKAKSDYFFKSARDFIYKNKYKYCNLQYLPASTVSVFSNDDYGNDVKYKQVVNLKTQTFDSSEVIHFKDIPIDGKLLGYSRLYAVKQELQILMNAKDYIGRFFDNNGTPSMIFIAKSLTYGTDTYNDFIKQLKSFKDAKNKNSNMVGLSDMEVIKLNDIAKDMQFKDLINKMTEICAMAFQMPPSRYGGSSKLTGEEATLANQGYQRSLFSDQNRIEKLFNKKLWKPLFNTEMVINKPYKEDLLRDANIQKMKTDVAQQRMDLNLITREVAADYLGIKKSDIPKEEDIEKPQSPQFMQGQVKEDNVQDESTIHKNTNKVPKNPNTMITNTN